MISVEEARERILAGLVPLAAEIVALSEAWGRVAARDVRARLMQPPADVSAMDGYAVRAADGVLGARLRVIGAAPAGHPFAGLVGPGQAVRIFTGGVVPDGADSILLQEDAASDGDSVTVNEAVREGRHIRRAGKDFAVGDVLVSAGRRMTPRDVGLAAAGNHPWVVLLATGDEIVFPGEAIPQGGIVSSNVHALAAMARAAGALPTILPVAPDDEAAIGAAADAAVRADLLVTTGGASVGDHDLVQSGLAARGMTLDFWKIAMRPGKPLIHGRIGTTPVLGLPGNPVSAFVCALLFLLPAVRRLSGESATDPSAERAVLGAPLPANDRRADFLRAFLQPGDPPVATPAAVQDSSMLATLAHSDALILRAPFATALDAGAEVEVLSFAALGL